MHTSLHAALLLASCSLAIWAGVVARRRRTVRGAASFSWMMFATAYWALASALNIVVPSLPTRIAISQLQYIGIMAVAPLWLMFTSEFARAQWLGDRTLRVLLWFVPVTTVLLAFTNTSHHLIWTDIQPIPGTSRLMYLHGQWFWIAVIYNYLVLATGTVLLFRALRHFPLPYRRQTAYVIAGATLPWIANVLYLLGFRPAGLDPTPISFAASGAAFVWGFYRHQLFGLVPIARDLVVDSIEDGVIVLDPQRNIVDMNPGARRLTGATVEAIGRPVDTVLPWWSRAMSEAATDVDLPSAVSVDGRSIEVEARPVRDGQSRFAGWLILARDVTARRTAESERRLLERRMLEQQKLESLSVLAGGVAHDFNNLLTGILGNADLLSRAAAGNPAMQKSADAIVSGAQRAADLVAKMQAYAGGGRVIAEIVDLDDLITDMMELLQSAVARQTTLEYVMPARLPRIRVDPMQIRQVILNLIVNACEATPEDGRVTVTAGTEMLSQGGLAEMTVATDAVPGRFVYVEVKDSGPGIDESDLARIFEPFFSTKQTGRGLGLAAVHGIVRSHKGALRVRSSAGNGTRFRVWFPVEESAS